MVAADVRRRILARKHFRLVTSAVTALATILELVPLVFGHARNLLVTFFEER